MQQTTYQHKEAFCLMLYRDTAGNEEWIWNSRDGVTPYIVESKQGLESHHVEWQKDKCLPEYKPKPGDRIFVDLTREKALISAREYVETQWEEMKEHDFFKGMTKEDAANHFANSWAQPGAPTLETVK